MHEFSLCQHLLEIILLKAKEAQCVRVKIVNVKIGQLVAVEPTSLTLCFELLTRDTIAQDAILNIIEEPGLARCESCGQEVAVRQYYDACSVCGCFSLHIMQGEAFQLQSMEVE